MLHIVNLIYRKNYSFYFLIAFRPSMPPLSTWPVSWGIFGHLTRKVSCWLIMQSGLNWLPGWWAAPLLVFFLCCLGSSWLVARVRYDCACCWVYESCLKIVSQPAAGALLDSSTLWGVLLWLKAADIEPLITRGENFKYNNIITFFFFCRSVPSSVGHSQSQESSTRVYSPRQRPGRRSR